MSRRLLMIAYQFPPVGGAGVQRVTKLCKYLPGNDWDVSVLTARNHSVPTRDASLGHDIPAETIIRAARSFEPGYGLKQAVQASGSGKQAHGLRRWLGRLARNAAAQVLQPDPQILWVPDAVRQGRRLLRETAHDAILVSGPPFSSFLAGAMLQRLSGLPLILDYRDEWGLANRYWENKSDSLLTRSLQPAMQRWALRHAHTVVATTQASADALRSEAIAAGCDIPVRCIYNGFDPDDMAIAPAANGDDDSDRLRLAHVGTLWNLTSAAPLVAAIERLAHVEPQLAAKLDVEIVGRCTPAERERIEQLRRLPCRLLQRDYVDHSAAVAVMRGADELCLLLADAPGAGRVVPGKTFEYLATNRNVLAIVPEGEVRAIVERQPGAAAFRPHQVEAIAQHLAQAVRSVRQRRAQTLQRNLDRFDRRAQAAEMAALLDGLVDSRTVSAQRPAATPFAAAN